MGIHIQEDTCCSAGTRVLKIHRFTLHMLSKLQIALILSALTAFFTAVHTQAEAAQTRWDFQAFYLGAQMVAHGERLQLYDLHAQAVAQQRYVDPARAVDLPDEPFIYPAAVALLFLPLVGLSMTGAYAVWTAFSLLIVVATVRVLQRALLLPAGNLPVVVALFFAPMYVGLIRGQVTLIVVLMYALALYFMTRNRLFVAGLVIGLGTLKYQLVLGFLAILVLKRLWTVLAGAAVTASLVVALSALVAGWRAMLHYPTFARDLLHSRLVGVSSFMVSVRGLLGFALGHEPATSLVIAISALLVVGAAVCWQDDLAAWFSVAMMVSMLVAFHARYQELNLLLVPFAVIVRRLKWNPIAAAWAVFTFVAVIGLMPTDQRGLAAPVCILPLLVGLYRSAPAPAVVAQPDFGAPAYATAAQ